MWWDDKNDSKDMQRFKNLTFLKMPVTNRERNEMGCGPVILIALSVLTLGGIAFAAAF